MKMYGNLDMLENELQEVVIPNESSFPATLKQGRIVFRNKRLYIAAEIVMGDPVWIPLTNEINTYVHAQVSAAATWNVNHDLRSTTVTVYVYDAATEKMIIPNEITIVDSNNLTITTNVAISGRAIIMEGKFDLLIEPSGYESFMMVSNSTQGDFVFRDIIIPSRFAFVGQQNFYYHDTANAKFLDTSYKLTGNGLVKVDTNRESFAFLADDWTQELWLYPTGGNEATALGNVVIKTSSNIDSTNYTSELVYNSTADTFTMRIGGLIGLPFVGDVVGTSTGYVNTWVHLAMVRTGANVLLFINGILEGSVSVGTGFSFPIDNDYFLVGADYDTGRIISGWVDSIRVENGYARYTAPFTPPTVEFSV